MKKIVLLFIFLSLCLSGLAAPGDIRFSRQTAKGWVDEVITPAAGSLIGFDSNGRLVKLTTIPAFTVTNFTVENWTGVKTVGGVSILGAGDIPVGGGGGSLPVGMKCELRDGSTVPSSFILANGANGTVSIPASGGITTYFQGGGTVATPTVNVPAGTYASAQSVIISCATSGASVYYTLNGATPTTSDTLYSTPVSVATSATLKANGFKSLYTPSAVFSAAYIISASGSATFTDNFTRSGTDPISNPASDGVGTWQTTNVGSSSSHLQIGGNQVSGTSNADGIARVAFPAFTGQHKATVTVPTGGVYGSYYSGPCVRVQSSSSASCYVAMVNGSTTDIRIDKVTDSGSALTFVTIGANFTVTALVPGDTISIGSSGTSTVTLTLFVNGVSQGTRTDSTSPWTGGQPGLMCYGTYPIAQRFSAVDY